MCRFCSVKYGRYSIGKVSSPLLFIFLICTPNLIHFCSISIYFHIFCALNILKMSPISIYILFFISNLPPFPSISIFFCTLNILDMSPISINALFAHFIFQICLHFNFVSPFLHIKYFNFFSHFQLSSFFTLKGQYHEKSCYIDALGRWLGP